MCAVNDKCILWYPLDFLKPNAELVMVEFVNEFKDTNIAEITAYKAQNFIGVSVTCKF